MTDSDIIARLTSRKFIVVVLSMVVNAVLRVTDVIDNDVYRQLSIALVGGYLMANVAQKVVAKDSTSGEAKS